jgi:hypothetical protein
MFAQTGVDRRLQGDAAAHQGHYQDGETAIHGA